MENLFLTRESWILVYVVQAAIWFLIASRGKEGAKYVAWAALLITSMIFVAGLIFEEVRQFFYTLTH